MMKTVLKGLWKVTCYGLMGYMIYGISCWLKLKDIFD